MLGPVKSRAVSSIHISAIALLSASESSLDVYDIVDVDVKVDALIPDVSYGNSTAGDSDKDSQPHYNCLRRRKKREKRERYIYMSSKKESTA